MHGGTSYSRASGNNPTRRGRSPVAGCDRPRLPFPPRLAIDDRTNTGHDGIAIESKERADAGKCSVALSTLEGVLVARASPGSIAMLGRPSRASRRSERSWHRRRRGPARSQRLALRCRCDRLNVCAKGRGNPKRTGKANAADGDREEWAPGRDYLASRVRTGESRKGTADYGRRTQETASSAVRGDRRSGDSGLVPVPPEGGQGT